MSELKEKILCTGLAIEDMYYALEETAPCPLGHKTPCFSNVGVFFTEAAVGVFKRAKDKQIFPGTTLIDILEIDDDPYPTFKIIRQKSTTLYIGQYVTNKGVTRTQLYGVL